MKTNTTNKKDRNSKNRRRHQRSRSSDLATISDNRPVRAQTQELVERITGSSPVAESTRLKSSMGRVSSARRYEAKGAPLPVQHRSTVSESGAIPVSFRSRFEAYFGQDFSSVRLRESSEATAIKAKAYTRGEQITFAPGRMKLHTRSGQALLGHELAHVVQQREGRVRPTASVRGIPINNQASLERDADHHSRAAMRGITPQQGAISTTAKHSIARTPVIQRETDDEQNPLEGEGFTLYRPANAQASTEAVVYCHGTISANAATFEVDDGFRLGYLAPHQTILNSGLDNAGEEIIYHAEPEAHNYELKPLRALEAANFNPANLQETADRTNRLVIMVNTPTTTQALVGHLHQAGYTQLLALHCREVSGATNRDWIYDIVQNPITNRAGRKKVSRAMPAHYDIEKLSLEEFKTLYVHRDLEYVKDILEDAEGDAETAKLKSEILTISGFREQKEFRFSKNERYYRLIRIEPPKSGSSSGKTYVFEVVSSNNWGYVRG